ncbi:glycosyltransferase [Nibricoccus sp. IMCC34717]|uniref:glycosyltransferase n=1 Tax=Nibricoccus sp. IMCC34717 TaxID=3034021 RepID=UPI00384FDAFA
MNIAFMIDSLAIGGAQKHIRQQACRLAGEGHAVWVICLNDEAHPKYLEPLCAAGVRVTIVGRRAVLTGRVFLDLPIELLRWRCEWLAVCLFVSTVVGRVVAMLAGVRVLTCLQARNLDYRWWQFALVTLTAPLSAWTISNSRSAIAFAVEHEGVNPRRATYVANLIDPPRKVGRRDWRLLGLPDLSGCYVIGSLGRLVWQKGYDQLIPIAAEVCRERPDARFVILGKGPEEGNLRALIETYHLQEKFFLAGEVADGEDWLESMDLYVQPSRFEGTPNAVQEALARGVPVLATPVDGVGEIVGIDICNKEANSRLEIERVGQLSKLIGLRVLPTSKELKISRLEALNFDDLPSDSVTR